MALPLKTKNQMSLITRELMAFTQVLGHEQVVYYADNEPTTRQISEVLGGFSNCCRTEDNFEDYQNL